MIPKYRYQWYQQLFENIETIHAEARQAVSEIGLEAVQGRVGLYPGSSTCPGPMPGYVLDAIIEANRVPVYPMKKAEDRLREVIKDLFGDRYEGVATNTCESGLRLAYETLFAPPTMRKGEAYRGRFITLYGEDSEFIASYGRPFPPKYKGLFIDRSVSAGEFAVEGKSLTNLDAIMVRPAGARYEGHGIKFSTVPLLTQVDHEKTFEKVAKVAEKHSSDLVGFTTVSYDSPGYGANETDESGVPKLMKMMGNLARELDVPFIVDTAASVPGLSSSPRDMGASVMLWSTDKPVRAPISGLMVGEEEVMLSIRKSFGLGGERFGGVSSHGKALFSLADPGRDAVVGLTTILELIRDDPEKVTRPIDEMGVIVVEEFANFEYQRFLSDMVITTSHGFGGIEINYEQTWKDDEFGIPIFTLEDMFADTNPIMSALGEMGIYPATIYSGNMILAPGLGTLDQDGVLMEEPTRLAVRALVRATEIVCKVAGLEP